MHESAPISRWQSRCRNAAAAGLLLLALAAGAACTPRTVKPTDLGRLAPGACRAIDGDTIICGRSTIRISNIDTPEKGRLAKCAAEADLAAHATAFTAERLAAGSVEMVPDGKRPRDRYGRTLATVRVNGQDLGEMLIAAGLARRWDGRRHPWCPET